MANACGFGRACSPLSMTLGAGIVWRVIAQLILDVFTAPVRVSSVVQLPGAKVINLAISSIEAELEHGKCKIICIVEHAALIAWVRRRRLELIWHITSHKVGLGLALRLLSDDLT